MKTSHLYLVRHAEPSVRHYKNYYPGPSLGKKGQEQAKKVAHFLADKNIQKVYASDFLRVQETLQPFLSLSKNIVPTFEKALWERESETESHESLVERVQKWAKQQFSEMLSCNSAIFSHCGPINMLLDFLDANKEKLEYTFTCPYGCHTPMAGVWQLKICDGNLAEGHLLFVENLE